MNTVPEKIEDNYWVQCMLNSYGIVFFSLNPVFAASILIVTFFEPAVGLSGLLAVLLVNIMAYFLGFNRDEIQKGLFGFNALFVGLMLRYEYSFNFTFVILFVTAISVLLMITVWLKGLLAKYNLPFLTLPFLFTYWIISLASSALTNVQVDESHIYVLNDITRNESSLFYQFVHSADNIQLMSFAVIYFKTLAGTFFQNSVLGGMLIALGMLYFSRITFSLSVIGFACAYFFYFIFGANVNDLDINLQGANFIFLAIAVGGFFLIPNIYSYITAIVLTPVLMFVLLSMGKVMAVFQVHALALSFNVVCTAFLFTLNQRLFQNYLQMATVQYFSPEKTIYKFLNSIKRFKNEHLAKISLPFAGEWYVSQGYDGKITHLGDWSKALDFVIVDSKKNTYREPGFREYFSRDFFYCYNREIYAPYDGYVYDIINTVEENEVGEVDTSHNWGNTVILNHLNGLFSQISHIKKDSFNVFVGQYITKGTFIATCGNSGRSPEPHIHFQLQTLPTVGAKTLAYPISYFIERKGTERFLKISEVPEEGAFISNVQVNQLLILAYGFYPGVKLSFQKEHSTVMIDWEVYTDAWNRTYIYCAATKSCAYFVNDGVMLYFTDFEGDKKSLLFYFYLAAYRQLLGYYDGVRVEDQVPLTHFNSVLVQPFQDLVAPFYLFTKASYSSKFTYVDNVYAPQKLMISTEVETKLVDRSFKKINFEFELRENRIHRFTIHHKNASETYINQTNYN